MHPFSTQSGVWYLLAGLAGSVALIVLPGASLRVMGAAALAIQVSLQVVLFVTAPVVEYRYEFFQVLLGIVLGTLGAVTAWRTRRSRRVAVPRDSLPPEGAF